MALPIAVLIASIMTFGNFGEHFELTAIKASGISLQRIMVPLIFLSFLISIGAFVFTEKIIPYNNLKMRTLLFDVRQQNPALDIRAGVFNNDVDGYSIRIGEKSRKTNMMYDFMIYDHTENLGNKTVIVADSGVIKVTDDIKFMVITMYNGCKYEETEEEKEEETKNIDKKTYPHVKNKFTEQTISIELKGFDFEQSDDAIFKKNYQMLNMKKLDVAIDSLSSQYKRKLDFTRRTLIGNKFFKNEIRLRNKEDSSTFFVSDSVKRGLSANNLPIIINIDTVFETEKFQEQGEILKLASEYAEKVKEQIVKSKIELRQKDELIAKYKIAWHNKLTYAVACFIFFFIGAPLGAIIKKGGFGLPMIISILFFLTYYIISMSGERLIKEGIWNATFGMWFSSGLFFPIGIFLTWKATKDSALLNFEVYKDIILKFFKQFKKK